MELTKVQLVLSSHVSPQFHRFIAVLFYVLDLGIIEVQSPVERGGLRVAEGARDAADVLFGVRVQEHQHFRVEFEAEEVEQLRRVSVRVERQVLVAHSPEKN